MLTIHTCKPKQHWDIVFLLDGQNFENMTAQSIDKTVRKKALSYIATGNVIWYNPSGGKSVNT